MERKLQKLASRKKQPLRNQEKPNSAPKISKKLKVAPHGLRGRSSCEPDIVRWVARHIDHPNPDPCDCPDPFAWTLLRECRSNPAFVAFFIEKLWSKLIPSRSQLDTGVKSNKIDGHRVLEIISRIEKISEDCKPKVEDVPDAFSSWDHDKDEL